MEKLIYTNEAGESVEFSAKSAYILETVEGLTGLQNEFSTSKTIRQDGITIVNSSLKERNIVIEGSIIKNPERNKTKLISVLNPKMKGILTHEINGIKRKIDCEIEQTPSISKVPYFKFQISLLCPNPYWADQHETGKEISTWIGGLSFPFSLPFRLKQRGETRQNIYNAGDVETPVEIIFRGPALNPKVTNLTTGEFIRIKQELASDDTLYITTGFGNKKVEIENNGVRQNAFHYIDLDSTFFNLVAGDNLIEYTTENELKPQSVEIRYYNRYLGV